MTAGRAFTIIITIIIIIKVSLHACYNSYINILIRVYT
jgi:hypothetical protein